MQTCTGLMRCVTRTRAGSTAITRSRPAVSGLRPARLRDNSFDAFTREQIGGDLIPMRRSSKGSVGVQPTSVLRRKGLSQRNTWHGADRATTMPLASPPVAPSATTKFDLIKSKDFTP